MRGLAPSNARREIVVVRRPYVPEPIPLAVCAVYVPTEPVVWQRKTETLATFTMRSAR
jgi:hypothetical protein